MGLNTKCI